MEGLIVFGSMLAFIFLSIPVSFAMIAVALLAYLFIADIPTTVIVQNMYYNLKIYALSAVFYFVFAGTVMVKGKSAKQLVEIANSLVGYLPGGLAIATVVACGLFGAISGSDLATLAAIGGIMVPALVAQGWEKNFAVGLVGSSALLGMIIPPSIPVIIYAIYVNVSVGGMFLGGVVPGLLIILTFSVYIYVYAKKKLPNEKLSKPDINRILKSLTKGKWALGMPVIIFGGIYGGICTVTESAALAAAYALIVEVVINRKVKYSEIPKMAVETATTTAVLLFLFGGAAALARYLSLEQIPQAVAEKIVLLMTDKGSFLLTTNIFLLMVGCLMDIASAIMVVMPILKPIYMQYEINDLHFGMIFLLNMYSGYLTPPIGLNLFAASGLFGISITQAARAYVPFFLLFLLVLLLVVLFPSLTLFLPSLF